MKETKFDIIRIRISEGKSVTKKSIDEAVKEKLDAQSGKEEGCLKCGKETNDIENFCNKCVIGELNEKERKS